MGNQIGEKEDLVQLDFDYGKYKYTTRVNDIYIPDWYIKD